MMIEEIIWDERNLDQQAPRDTGPCNILELPWAPRACSDLGLGSSHCSQLAEAGLLPSTCPGLGTWPWHQEPPG